MLAPGPRGAAGRPRRLRARRPAGDPRAAARRDLHGRQMPGLRRLDLARVIARSRPSRPVVFVTAHERHAVDAFELDAVDYVLKPVRDERLSEAVRRVVAPARGSRIRAARPRAGGRDHLVELGGVSRFVPRADVRYVEAQGDYARLHTGDREPPRAGAPDHPRGPVGRRGLRPHPPRPWSRSATSPSGALERGRTTVVAGGRRAPSSAGGTPASCATCSCGVPSRCAGPVTSGPSRAAAAAGPGHEPPHGSDPHRVETSVGHPRSTPRPASARSTSPR